MLYKRLIYITNLILYVFRVEPRAKQKRAGVGTPRIRSWPTKGPSRLGLPELPEILPQSPRNCRYRA